MRQKIKIVAINKTDNGFLTLLNKNSGELEVPQGNLSSGEQPEACLIRTVLDLVDEYPTASSLNDVISYFDKNDDRNYLYIIFFVTLPNSGLKISANSSKYSAIEYVQTNDNYVIDDRLSESSRFILNIVRQDSKARASKATINLGTGDTDTSEYTLFTDGGSRGNPGPSAAGYVLMKNDEIIDSGGEFLGITDNAQAEYHGLRLGLEAALAKNVDSLSVKMDNLMVVNQVNGIYRVKNRALWPVYSKIKKLTERFRSLQIVQIRREFNTLADGKVNEVLDEEAKERHQ